MRESDRKMESDRIETDEETGNELTRRQKQPSSVLPTKPEPAYHGSCSP